jgi:alkylhydroperoxidase family enzyme
MRREADPMIDSGPADSLRRLWDRDSDQAGRAAVAHYGSRRRALLAGAWDLSTLRHHAQDVVPYLSRAEAAEQNGGERP